MSATPLQALAAEAGNRLALNDFELMQDIVLRATQEHNSLGIEPFPLEGGLIRCVGSRIMTAQHVRLDELTIENDELRVHRRYPDMVAEAHLVGTWPRSEEAALYSVYAPFNSEAEMPGVPFASTAADVIADNTHPYQTYKQVESSDGVITFGKNPWYLRGEVIQVIGTPDTRLHTDRYGVNTLDDEEGLDVHLTGPATLQLPEAAFLQVLRSGVLSSPEENTAQPIVIPVGIDPPISSKIRVKKGVQPILHDNGSVAIPGEEEPEYESHRYKNNPHVPTEQAYSLLQASLPMYDITAQFLSNTRGALLRRVGVFDPQQSYDTLRTEARQAVREYIPTRPIEPIALGYLAVGNRIGELIAHPPHRDSWVIDVDYLEKANKY